MICYLSYEHIQDHMPKIVTLMIQLKMMLYKLPEEKIASDLLFNLELDSQIITTIEAISAL